MKSKCIIPLQMIFFLLTIIEITRAQPQEQLDFVGGSCLRSENISTNGTYHNNIQTLLRTFRSFSSSNKFFTSSEGKGLDRVNGYYFCRPDLSLETCRNCINATIDIFTRFCFDKKEAIFWYQECTLGYTNASVVSPNITDPWSYQYGDLNVSLPVPFRSLLNQTMQRLISEAVSPTNEHPLFKVRSDNFTSFEGIFGMVWCKPDITAEECEDCLTIAFDRIPECCGGSAVFTIVLMPVCQLRYDTAPFDFSPPLSSPSPPSLSPPTLAPVP